MSVAIEVRDLSVRYGDTVALRNVDLDVAAGRVTGLVGMNG
jgi:manganese transport system ATP-binding protein